MALVPSSSHGGGGSSSAAGATGEIQFNDAAAFGADPDFVWVNGQTKLLLGSTANATAQIIGNAPGVQIQILAAPGDATHVGGEIGITSGASAGNDGGTISIASGSDSAGGSGGNVIIETGTSAEFDGGDIALHANAVGPAGNRGGDINVIAGQGTVHGGNVLVQGGASDGNVQVYSGDGNQALQLDANGLNVATTKVGFYSAAPVAQPAAPTTLADVIAALKALGLVAT